MEKGLSGKKIVIAGSRKIEEMSIIIEKQGGVPIHRPLQGTVFLAEQELEPELKKFIKKGADWTVFTTGIGLSTIVEVSEKIGVTKEFLSILHQSKVAARGYKTLAVLKRLGVTPIAVDDDGTNRGLVRALKDFDFQNKRVMVQLHGEKAPALISFLEAMGADVLQLLPYQHIPPQIDTVEMLIEEILSDKVDAICFTTGIQVRSLFEYARKTNHRAEIISSFKEKVLAVAVGKVTAEALSEEGIDRFLVPENERMGAMIIELSHYYQNQKE